MLKTLVGKQLTEIFKGYFYNAKTNKARSKGGTIGYILLFLVLIFGCLGGTFAFLAKLLCAPLCTAGYSWLYFSLMTAISLLLGIFGSVFNTYSGLYLSKDNDLLLSMPIPVRVIIASRLIGVYIMGSLYSSMAFIPTMIVYGMTEKQTVASVLSMVLMYVAITAVVLICSSGLGWVVAKISIKLKNKSFLTVLVSLLFMAAYYVCYYKASMMISEFLANIQTYGNLVQGKIYPLYMLGAACTGNVPFLLIILAITAGLLFVIWTLLNKTFIRLTTSTGKQERAKEEKKAVRQNSLFFALLKKEARYLKSSPNYILNCALGVFMLPAAGIAFLLKGDVLLAQYAAVLPGSGLAAISAGALAALCCMCDTATPSVSLEGKALWILQSLPIPPMEIMKAKMALQLITSFVPSVIAFVLICLTGAFEGMDIVAGFVYLAVFEVLFAEICMVIGIKKPILVWDTEIVPIKQNLGVLFAMLGGMLLGILPAGICFAAKISQQGLVLFGTALLYGVLAAVIYRWLKTKGTKLFQAL